ncbi:MAG: PAS domain-containing hybrid sensor histidine kinase/response regulator, partial [Vicinamibacteria bacterium]
MRFLWEKEPRSEVEDPRPFEVLLRRSEDRLRLALDAGGMGTWERDLTTGAITWDARQWELWGFECGGGPITRERLLARVHPDDVALVEAATAQALESGKFQVEFRIVRPDGEERWLAGKGGVIPDSSGKPLRLTGVNFDVTVRKQAEEALRRSERIYRGIGESIDYGVWVCDSEGRNVYASPSFLELVGLTQEECSAFGWARVLHPDDVDATIAAWKECVRSGSFWEREHRYLGVDGNWHDVLARGVPIRDDAGRIVSWAGINLDVSAFKRAQEALEKADRRKDEFLATLAHELRNPLAPLRNGLELLRLTRDDAQATAEVQAMMERQLLHLLRLVDDLLDVSRITRGKVELRRESVELATVIRNALETVRPTLERSGQELIVDLPDEPVHLDADAVRLAQVLSNLLDNACKYTEGKGRIALATVREGETVRVAVKDEGVGIPAESLESIFEMFSQVDDSLERVGGGLGIGLSLVKGLVELHGGKVEARSEGPGHGSEFVVTLPIARVEASERIRAPSEGSAARVEPRRILVVDDNRDAAESLARLLKAHGHEVSTAFDGPSAIATARAFQPAFVLLDIGMPGLDGYDTARRMRESPGLSDAVLIATTGWG